MCVCVGGVDRVNKFFTMNPSLKKKKNLFILGDGVGVDGARVS